MTPRALELRIQGRNQRKVKLRSPLAKHSHGCDTRRGERARLRVRGFSILVRMKYDVCIKDGRVDSVGQGVASSLLSVSLLSPMPRCRLDMHRVYFKGFFINDVQSFGDFLTLSPPLSPKYIPFVCKFALSPFLRTSYMKAP